VISVPIFSITLIMCLGVWVSSPEALVSKSSFDAASLRAAAITASSLMSMFLI
jgi:hypothetical protein